MKKIAKRFLLSILTVSLLIVAMLLSLSRSVRAQNQDVQVIEIAAKKYEYSISPVHVKVGTKVQLKVTIPTTIMVSRSGPFPMVPKRMAPAGWCLLRRRIAGSLRRERRRRLSFWRKRPARIHSSVAIPAAWDIEG